MRVAGPPYDTATGLVAGTSANTIAWYTGETGTDPARGTAVAQIDNSLTVSYGARANEQALTNTIKSIAVYAVDDLFGERSECGRTIHRSQSARRRCTRGVKWSAADFGYPVGAGLCAVDDDRRAQRASNNASATLTDLLQGIEQADPDEVASQILALQTQLQASLQTTAMLYKLSIVNYL